MRNIFIIGVLLVSCLSNYKNAYSQSFPFEPFYHPNGNPDPVTREYCLSRWEVCRIFCDAALASAVGSSYGGGTCADENDPVACAEEALDEHADCYNACDYGTGSQAPGHDPLVNLGECEVFP